MRFPYVFISSFVLYPDEFHDMIVQGNTFMYLLIAFSTGEYNCTVNKQLKYQITDEWGMFRWFYKLILAPGIDEQGHITTW